MIVNKYNFTQDEEKPFRVYFKGMVNSDLVKGSLVQLAAIGVAICDPKDNLILKIQKPASATAMSRETLEAKALIEGLNAAFSIGIKKANVYFDYRVLYNHVSLSLSLLSHTHTFYQLVPVSTPNFTEPK